MKNNSLMDTVTYQFGKSCTAFHFNASFTMLKEMVDPEKTVLITDDHIAQAHPKLFKGWNSIILKPGEEYKVQLTVDAILDELITMGVDRSWHLVGVGGGVVTDLTGYAAAIYMRGIRFGFIPTTLLAMVDASIGGKNGVDVGPYKNLAGTIRQPEFILYDSSLLKSLPVAEWQNGFAEIIKHAAIRDKEMFEQLARRDLDYWMKHPKDLDELIRRNAMIKAGVVKKDELEKNERRLLNFGHTIGHALETQYELSHGQAVSIGMTMAAGFSKVLLGLKHAERIPALLEKYGLPTFATFNPDKVIQVMQKDKKKVGDSVNFILLKKIGKGVVHPISWVELTEMIKRK